MGEAEEIGIRKTLEKGKSIVISPTPLNRSCCPPLALSSKTVTDRHRRRSSLHLGKREAHNDLMERILDGLQDNPGENRETRSSDGASDKVDSEEEMTLSQYQSEARVEARFRKGVAKAASRAKKGRTKPY